MRSGCLHAGNGASQRFFFGIDNQAGRISQNSFIFQHFAAGFLEDKIPQALGVFNSAVDDISGPVDRVYHQLFQILKFIKIMSRTGVCIPIRILQVPPGRYTKHAIGRRLPAHPDVFEKIRHNLLFEFGLIQPVAFIQNTNQRFSTEFSNKWRQKIQMIPPLGVFGVKDTDQHIGFGNGSFDQGDVLFKRSAVRIRGIDQKHMFEVIGCRG